jgi:hypothetical protein
MMACWSGFSRDLFFLGLRAISRLKPLLPIIICPAVFADYQVGLDAYHNGDYSTAMSEWKAEVSHEPAAENLAIYREALYAIGMLYWQGEGVEQDHGVSAVWLKQAADINHPGAQTKLGYLYTMGEGVAQNYGEAARYFQLAAAQGDPDARHNLDMMSQQGLLAQQDVAVTDAAPIPGLDAGEAWIQQQDPEHYTIQVIALSAPEKLHAFISGHENWAPFAIYRQSRYEQPLWVLVQGIYPDVETARAARDTFPPGIQKNDDLWIRKFGMVQRLIK